MSENTIFFPKKNAYTYTDVSTLIGTLIGVWIRVDMSVYILKVNKNNKYVVEILKIDMIIQR